MDSLWPSWLAIAGVGALHGLNPATGWALAAAWGMRSQGGMQVLRALVPIGLGHIASVALVAVAVALGRPVDRDALLVLAGVLLLACALAHLRGGRALGLRTRAQAGHAALALWSFMMSSLHGAGLMLVPALVPLCLGADASALDKASAFGPLALALVAVGIHAAAMLAVTGVIAAGVCRGFWSTGAVPRRAAPGSMREGDRPSILPSWRPRAGRAGSADRC